MKILLIQPPFLEEKIASLEKYAPMGLIAIAGYIRENINDINIQIYDANAENATEEQPIKKIVNYILQKKPDILGITSMTTNIQSALEISKAVKQANPKIIIILGGVHSTIAPKQVLANQAVDFIVIGEGEITLDQLLKNINNPQVFKNIKGLGYKENGKIKINPRRELIKDLNQLPIPAYDLLKIDNYLSPYNSKTPFVSAMRSRGCPFRCIFCGVQNMFGRIYRIQSPERTIQEIDYLIDKFKIKEIGFKDSEFIINQKNVSQFCDLLIARNYDLTWSCNARVDCGSYELYMKMKKAGCQNISLGAESGDQNILDILKKDITVEQIKNTVNQIKAAKIKVSTNFMIGSPYETKKTIEKTINLAKEINPDYAYFSLATPFLGTELREMAIKNNWLINKDMVSITYMKLNMNATNLSDQELKKYLKKAYRSFYFRPSYIFKRLLMLNKEDIKTSIKGLSAILKTSL